MSSDNLNQIEQNLRSRRIDRRKTALDELAKLPADTALPILKQLARENDFALRCLAMMGFGNHRTELSFQILKQSLEQEQDSSVLAEAANSIFEFGERSIAPLQNLFDRSSHWLVRQTIVSILVETEDPQVLLAIATKAIQDEVQTTKETGILALSRLLNTELKQKALDLFTQLAQDDNWRTRWRTAIALTAADDPQSKQLLVQLQQDKNYRVVAAALDGLGLGSKKE